MEFNNQEVWIGVEDLTHDKQFVEQASQEFVSLPEAIEKENALSFTSNRRDFLKYLGFGVGAATVAASCEIPVKRAIPYVTKPDTIVPGVANYYASSFVNGSDYASVLVKTREGRPIKIENNSLGMQSAAGARIQASVLSLYDTNRIQEPGKIKDGSVAKMSWADLDKAVVAKLGEGGAVRIVTNSISSPTTKKAIADFSAKYPNTKVVAYDPISYAAILDANNACFGVRVIPSYKFDAADVVVSFNADFLGTWVSPSEFSTAFAKGRKVNAENPKMNRLIQVESRMSLTGSNADNRVLVKPSEQGAAIAFLANEIVGGIAVPALNDKAKKALTKVAQDLKANAGKSLVVSSSTNVNEQILVNAINATLNNYNATIDLANANLLYQGSDADVQGLISELESGAVSVLMVLGDANPVFELPNGDKFGAAVKKAGLSISFCGLINETTAACQYSAPAHHYLESWGDAKSKAGVYSLVQPTIAPLFNTRQAELSLLTWAGVAPQSAQPMYDYVRALWQTEVFPKQKEFTTFPAFWDATLHDGVFSYTENTARVFAFAGNAAAAAAGVTQPVSGVEIEFFESINLGNGQYATNPWLMEMPDPITRTVWANTLAVPVNFDGINDFNGYQNLKDGDTVDVDVNGKKVTCVVVRQFGQMENTVAIALGYGRPKAGVCSEVGSNVNNLIPLSNGTPKYFATAKVSAKTGKDKAFACVQHHHTMGVTAMGKEEGKVINADEKSLGYKGFQGSLVKRSIIRRTDLKEVKKFIDDLKHERAHHQKLNSYTLYRGHEDRYKAGLHWNMYVDLNACTGCAACTVACMAENNVPVVGKHEVARHHEMTWLRIDRYYYGDVENPSVVYQPMMCQHCDNAPCENVCPVNATNHSSEGLNQMTYNRCIGTRYCANNCPYKVRRFNWHDYTTADIFPANERNLNDLTLGFSTEMPYGADNLTRMVLNPDVTVRTRGVIEKCSFCVQRIQEGKLTAKKESRQLTDGDVQTACQTACPTGAITFGDRNNPESAVSKAMKSPLTYLVLEEVNVASNVNYSARITNKLDLA